MSEPLFRPYLQQLQKMEALYRDVMETRKDPELREFVPERVEGSDITDEYALKALIVAVALEDPSHLKADIVCSLEGAGEDLKDLGLKAPGKELWALASDLSDRDRP